jgi:hypothetical protein
MLMGSTERGSSGDRLSLDLDIARVHEAGMEGSIPNDEDVEIRQIGCHNRQTPSGVIERSVVSRALSGDA